MKSLLSFCILLALLHAGAYPQEIKPDFVIPDSGPYSLKPKEQLLPLDGQKLFSKSLYKHLPKRQADYSSGDPVYHPSEIVIDSSIRHIRFYDNMGNLMTNTLEIILDGLWVKCAKNAFIYDSKGNMLTQTRYIWSNGNWNNDTRHNYTYDTNNNLITYNAESFQDNAWMKNSSEFYSYDSNGRLLSLYYQSTLNNKWTDIYRMTATYSEDGRELVLMEEGYENGTWVNMSRTTRSFDSSGNEVSSFQEWWRQETWVKTHSFVFTYDSHNNLISEIFEEWGNGKLNRRDRLSNSYDDNGNSISTLVESWHDNAFVKERLIERTYNETGNPLEFLTKRRAGDSWENSYRIFYTYDHNGNASKGENFWWNEGAWEYISTDPEDFDLRYNEGKKQLKISGKFVEVKYKLIPEEGPSAVREITLLQNFPNPFNLSTAIDYSIKRDGRVKLSVYDVLGKLSAVIVDEYQSAGHYFVRFDASGLPSGVYIYRLESGGYQTSKKFILMK